MAVALHELGLEDLVLVVTHPAQLAYIDDITELLTNLRNCKEPADYNDFQREALFPALYGAERHRSAVRRCMSRVRAGKSLPDDVPLLPKGDDPHSLDTWRIEDIVWTRLCRQLRAVGDALGWRASGFNRLLFVIGSSHQQSGPMADKEGLVSEIGVLEETYARSSNFVLLNDLTSCMRIGDLTELPVGGRPWLYEVKKNPANARST